MAGKKLDEERQLFYEYLRQNGLKKTRQKDLILETFVNNEGHLSVEDIYALVKKRDKRVGIVTVFRTLKSLTACGIAKEIALGDGLTRFEHCYHHPVHHHIICTTCHQVIEFVSPELERVQESIVTQYDFKPIHQRIQIYGMCHDCRAEQPRADGPSPDTGKVFARDALRMALAMLNQGIDFYRTAAVRNQDPTGREIFELLAGEEESHARLLEKELELLHQKERALREAPVFLHFEPRDLQRLIPSLHAGVASGGLCLDARSAVETAMQIEERAAGFFLEYAERFAETEGKQIFLRFVEHARNHHAAMLRRAQAVISAGA